MGPRLIEGEVEPSKSEIERLLEREVAELRRQLDSERSETARREGQALAAVKVLRKQLLPMYRAFQAIFGEIDAVVTDAETSGPAARQQGDAARGAWESWIAKFGAGSTSGRFIIALLEHAELSAKQMKVAAKMADQTVYDTARRLSALGLIKRSGGKYSLTQL